MARRGDGIYKRGHSYYIDFQLDGKRYMKSLGRFANRTVARERAIQFRNEVMRGEVRPKRKNIRFNQAAERYLAWVAANKKPKTVRSYQQCIAQLSRSFEGKRLGQLDTFTIERHKQARIQAGARIAANREVAVLKAMINRCIAWGIFDGPNPATQVKLLKEAQTTRALEPDEAERLLAAAPEPVRTVILLGLDTGLRVQAEILTLTWGNVNLRQRLLTVEAAYAKSGKVRTVPMNRDVFAALEALRPMNAPPDAPVFRRRDGRPLRSIRTVFEKACRKAGLHRVRIHSLRHTFATRLVEASVDLRTVQDIGGWSSLSLIERYAHVAAQRKAEAVERLAESREISRQGQGALDVQTAKVLSLQARAASSAW